MDPEKASETEFLHSLSGYPLRTSRRGATADPAPADLARLFDNCPDLLCITDAAGYFQYVNPAWMRSLGWDPELLVGSPLTSFVHSEHRDGARTEIDRASWPPCAGRSSSGRTTPKRST